MEEMWQEVVVAYCNMLFEYCVDDWRNLQEPAYNTWTLGYRNGFGAP
jgi:hypothetical protein